MINFSIAFIRTRIENSDSRNDEGYLDETPANSVFGLFLLSAISEYLIEGYLNAELEKAGA